MDPRITRTADISAQERHRICERRKYVRAQLKVNTEMIQMYRISTELRTEFPNHNGWSRDRLTTVIRNEPHLAQGAAANKCGIRGNVRGRRTLDA